MEGERRVNAKPSSIMSASATKTVLSREISPARHLLKLQILRTAAQKSR